MDRRDPQRETLYEWERAYVDARWPPETMSAEEVRALVVRVSAVLRIPEPTISFKSIDISCKARPLANRLDIADWGRTRPTILHEMAHLGSWRAVLRGDTPHGVAFTTMAIALYHRFLGMPLDYLEESAASRGLAFVPAAMAGNVLAGKAPETYAEDF
jgi:hypothetical protein